MIPAMNASVSKFRSKHHSLVIGFSFEHVQSQHEKLGTNASTRVILLQVWPLPNATHTMGKFQES